MAANPSSEDPRLWHLSASFDLCAHRPYFGDDAWGACFSSQLRGLPTTVHTHLRITPEGMLLHAACDRCSARDEVVVDFRKLDGDPESELLPVELTWFGGERVRELQVLLGQEPMRAWAEGHRECMPLPGTPELPRPVAAALEQLHAFKAAELRERGRAEAAVVAVLPGSGAWWFDAEVACEAERMLTGFRVREAIRGLCGPALAVLSVEEIVTGETSELRFAMLMDGGNWVGRATIDRFDRPRPGPGRLHPIIWSPLRETAPWLDGLRARTRHHPLPRELPEVNR